jgi:hypothetical protein
MSMQPRAIHPIPQPRAKAYTVATLVTKPDQYAAMIASFKAGGFDGADCEYLYLDNTGANALSAYQGLNRLLDEAEGEHVILCHQDVRLLDDGRAVLDRRLTELAGKAPHWALAGNSGGIGPGKLALRISDPHGRDVYVGALPEQAQSLDENFIVVRRSARVSFSRDLEGFHFYGTDLCLQAEIAGWTSHVIDFHLEHLSAGFKSPDFYVVERQFREKYARAFRSRWIQTTCALLPLSASPTLNLLGNAAARPFARLARKLPNARGWADQRLASPRAPEPKA